jgi:hypothetical protein
MLTNTHAQKHGYLKSLTQPVKGKHFEVAWHRLMDNAPASYAGGLEFKYRT